MDSILLKYSMLPAFEKKEVSDFIDFLLAKSRKQSLPEQSNPKRQYPDSVWSEEDVKIFEENKKYFDQWNPPTW